MKRLAIILLVLASPSLLEARGNNSPSRQARRERRAQQFGPTSPDQSNDSDALRSKVSGTLMTSGRVLIVSGVSAMVVGAALKCASYLESAADVSAWEKIKAGVKADSQRLSAKVGAAKNAAIQFVSGIYGKVRDKLTK